jgi:glycosyltransferase involved in cell wall biosynthesis
MKKEHFGRPVRIPMPRERFGKNLALSDWKTVPVSVVVPVHNGAEFIGAAINSIIGQSRRPAEIIVVDDGSTDESAAVASSFPDIKLIRQSQQGQGRARNEGARMATQEYLSFLDADDLWSATRIALQLEHLEADCESCILFGHAVEFRALTPEGIPEPLGLPMAAHLPGAMLLRTGTFWEIGGYQENWRVGEVVEWYARALDSAFAVKTLPEVLLYRRLHHNNLGRKEQNPSQEYLKIMRKIVERRRSE